MVYFCLLLQIKDLQMTIQITLDAMKFYSYHGVGAQERKVGNTFVADLVLSAPIEEAVKSGAIEDTINYATVYDIVKREMAIPSNLLEHVAGRILVALKEAFPELLAIELRLSKMNPPLGGDLRSASVILKETYTQSSGL